MCDYVAVTAAHKLPAASATRLKCALNASVFYYEILNLRERAVRLAADAARQCIDVDDAKCNDREALLMLQALAANTRICQMDGPRESNTHALSHRTPTTAGAAVQQSKWTDCRHY